MGLCAGGPSEPPEEQDDSSLSSEQEHKTQSIDVTKTNAFHRTLAKGSVCRVVAAINKDNNEDASAIKIMNKNESLVQKLYKHEVDILSRIDHEHIVKFINSAENNSNCYIITGLCKGGQLFDHILDSEFSINVTESFVASLIHDMLTSIKYLHDKNIVHRNLNAENFLFEDVKNTNIKLIDFGCARIVDDDNREYESIVGNVYYLAPELVSKSLSVPKNGIILKSSDIWSIGIIAYIIMTGKPPFDGKTNTEIFTQIIEDELKFPKDIDLSDNFKDFVSTILIKNPLKRMTIDEGLRHSWVQRIDVSDDDENIHKDVLRRLKLFNYQSKLKKAITRCQESYGIYDEKDDIQSHFTRLDKDGDGFLDSEELEYLLSDIGFASNTATEEAKSMLEAAEDNEYIDLQEFMKLYARRRLSKHDQYIHKSFDVFDHGDGYIDGKDVVAVLGDDFKFVVDMISDVEEISDYKLSFEEFKKAMQRDSIEQQLEAYARHGGEQIDDDDRVDNEIDIDDDEEDQKQQLLETNNEERATATDEIYQKRHAHVTELTEIVVQSKEDEPKINRGFSILPNEIAEEKEDVSVETNKSSGCLSRIADIVNWSLLLCTAIHLNWTLIFVGCATCNMHEIMTNTVWSINSITTAILVSYYGFIYSGVYDELQSWMVAYVGWITIIWSQFLIDAIVGNYHFDTLKSLSVVRMRILGISLTEKKRLYAHKYNDHWMIAISSLLPTSIIGFATNYYLEEKFLLRCDSKYKTGDICYDDGRGCCVLLSSHKFESAFDFAARLASHLLAAFGFIRIIAWFMMSKSRFSKLAKKDK